MVQKKDQYGTNQTVVASYLVYKGFDLADLSWDSVSCTFYFADTPALREELGTFINGKALVEPQGFNNTFTQVRRRMFDAKDGK